MRRTMLFVLALAAALVLMPTAAVADPNNESATFQLLIEVPNVAQAPNGDQVAITGEGEFSVHSKSVEADGGFTHTDSQGNTVAAGTWEATQLLSFEFYGCRFIPAIDVDLGDDNLCGGALKLAVNLMPDGTNLQLKGVLTIFCIIGPQAPPTHEDPTGEGINLVVPGHANFNQIVGGGMNVYIRMPEE
jgi:hypothetical protein